MPLAQEQEILKPKQLERVGETGQKIDTELGKKIEKEAEKTVERGFEEAVRGEVLPSGTIESEDGKKQEKGGFYEKSLKDIEKDLYDTITKVSVADMEKEIVPIVAKISEGLVEGEVDDDKIARKIKEIAEKACENNDSTFAWLLENFESQVTEARKKRPIM